VERLQQRFDFLQGREVGLAPRHRTLRATIEWSTDLLEPHLRDFFARLSVFRGGWTLEAAEIICAPSVCEEWDVLDFLEQLRASSLISTFNTTSGTRYRLLEMLREWGDAQLDETQRSELRARHFAFYTELAESAPDPITLSQRGEELAAESGNFRAALSWALERTDEYSANDGARLAGALGGLWEARCQNAEGNGWIERALLKTGEVESPYRARLLFSGGMMEWCCGGYSRACALLEASLEMFRKLGDETGETAALDYWAKVLGVMGNFEEERIHGQKAVAFARKNNDIARLMSSLITTSWGALNSGHYEEAVECLDEGAALGERFDQPRVVATCRATKPFALILNGHIEEAREASEYALESLDERAGSWASAFTRGAAAVIALALGNVETARQMLPEAAVNFHAISTRWEVASVLSECGNLAVMLGDYERAALIYGSTEALRNQCGHVMLTCIRPGYEAGLARLQAEMNAETLERLWQRGARLSLDETVALTAALRPDSAESVALQSSSQLRMVG
jgi:non-specific serine/threonine protein kinase